MGGDTNIDNRAAEKAIELALNPDPDKLCEFTVLSKGSTMVLAIEMAKHHYFDPDRHIKNEDGTIRRYVTIPELATQLFFKLQRSVEGKCLNRAFDLAAFAVEPTENFQGVWYT